MLVFHGSCYSLDLWYCSVGLMQAEVIIKIRAEFPSNITANTILVQMPLPKYTSRYFLNPIFFMVTWKLENFYLICDVT